MSNDGTEERAAIEGMEKVLEGVFGTPVPKRLDWVTSEDGKHAWLGSNDSGRIGTHVDEHGVWLDLRSAGTKRYPEVALCVPKEGGVTILQISNGSDTPVVLNLLAVAQQLQRLAAADGAAGAASTDA